MDGWLDSWLAGGACAEFCCLLASPQLQHPTHPAPTHGHPPTHLVSSGLLQWRRRWPPSPSSSPSSPVSGEPPTSPAKAPSCSMRSSCSTAMLRMLGGMPARRSIHLQGRQGAAAGGGWRQQSWERAGWQGGSREDGLVKHGREGKVLTSAAPRSRVRWGQSGRVLLEPPAGTAVAGLAAAAAAAAGPRPGPRGGLAVRRLAASPAHPRELIWPSQQPWRSP